MGTKFREYVDSTRECSCGRGTITQYKIEIESDFPPFDRVQNGRTEVDCPYCNKKDKKNL